MKPENDLPEIDQAQHERLCAYVFGELAGDERTAFERELFASPALQAEHARLTATIGLVRSAIPDEGLSHAARRDVVAAAKRSRFRRLGGRRLLSLAAAGLMLAGGALAVRWFAGGGAREHSIYGLGDQRVARRAAPEEKRVMTAPKARGAASGELLDALASKEESPAAAPEFELGALLSLEALGYAGDENELHTGLVTASEADQVGEEKILAANVPAPQDAALGQVSVDGLGFDLAAVTPQAEPEFLSESPFDADSFQAALQKNQGPNSPGPAAVVVGGGAGGKYAARFGGAKFESPKDGSTGFLRGDGPKENGKYRGPGDSAPPGSASAPSLELRALGYGGDGGESDARSHVWQQPLTREEVAVQLGRLLESTCLAPNESPRDMFFRYWGDSPFVDAFEQPTSTFAVDVDTASYALARAYLVRGQLPPRAAVRTEEFVNYFKADQPPPRDGQPFAIGLELAPSRFASDARAEVLRVALRAADVAEHERRPVALTFVIDNSGSMREGGRLELVKRSLALLLRQLYPGDTVAIVKFSNQAAIVTRALPATRRGELEELIQALPIEGGTNVEAGLRLGYELALESLARRGVNRVVLCSDGVGNIGETSASGLLALVADARAKGIYLNTVGVGMGNHNDAFLEQLADRGDGVCNYVDSEAEAKRVFVDGLARALHPVARDVKIQLEFDAAQVESWRLFGYENRALEQRHFRDDAIDAGEVNAGHQVVALYELVRRSTRDAPLATVRVRYKPPFAIDQGKEGAAARAEAERARELERSLNALDLRPGFQGASNAYQRDVLVAQFAEVLRGSVHARGDSFGALLEDARRLERTLAEPDFSEFVGLLTRASPLLEARAKEPRPAVQEALDELARTRYELARSQRIGTLEREAAAARARLPESQRQDVGEPEGLFGDEAAERRARAEEALQKRIQELEQRVRAELERPQLDAGVHELLHQLGYGR